MADREGGYAASQDADVGLDDDGDYFTWTRDEAAAVLTPDELEIAAAYYDIGTAGEMHHDPGKNVLFISATVSALAQRTGLSTETIETLLRSAQDKLRTARAQRRAPFVDRTRYTNWNAMMASAMLRAGAVLGDDWCRSHALLTLTRLRGENEAGNTVGHTPGGIHGLLDDQAQTAAAALDAYETTGEREWLEWGERLMDRVWADYWDSDNGVGPARRACCRPGRSRCRTHQPRRLTGSPVLLPPGCTSSPALPAGNSGAKSSCGRLPGARASWDCMRLLTSWR